MRLPRLNARMLLVLATIAAAISVMTFDLPMSDVIAGCLLYTPGVLCSLQRGLHPV